MVLPFPFKVASLVSLNLPFLRRRLSSEECREPSPSHTVAVMNKRILTCFTAHMKRVGVLASVTGLTKLTNPVFVFTAIHLNILVGSCQLSWTFLLVVLSSLVRICFCVIYSIQALLSESVFKKAAQYNKPKVSLGNLVDR